MGSRIVRVDEENKRVKRIREGDEEEKKKKRSGEELLAQELLFWLFWLFGSLELPLSLLLYYSQALSLSTLLLYCLLYHYYSTTVYHYSSTTVYSTVMMNPPAPSSPRFTLELEFVLSLANPHYLSHLAVAHPQLLGITSSRDNDSKNDSKNRDSTNRDRDSKEKDDSEAFAAYLAYLYDYWRRPEYVQFLSHPGATLRALRLLQEEAFRVAVIRPQVIDMLIVSAGEKKNNITTRKTDGGRRTTGLDRGQKRQRDRQKDTQRILRGYTEEKREEKRREEKTERSMGRP
ncbi:RNA polymerase II mediator complex subunit Soh1, putative [Trichophyton verrucosum HKI 0517]|uniref:Mediator of RNA polymerase II transcription subunit 31 n=1 Tax=Trichophyton verrucosum (strain HKI 0517) TaxID=663202 RepID=D4DDC7_TRIVH|nr:RNA polymerase II mediator complex subunit Soh1, putative [Trichophyton verrucosum HKI 0517]EFE40135.1 RNA polymerase II mediator complex subunit Soh1, putative [Trichophyton verrucosum HKI 0517]